MKLIIAGSRTIDPSVNSLCFFITHFFPTYQSEDITEIVSGTAEGVDQAGEKLAQECIEDCAEGTMKLTKFPANWDKYGKRAGPIRNRQMAEYADALLLIWDGKSKGSANMKKEMQRLNKPIYEVILKNAK